MRYIDQPLKLEVYTGEDLQSQLYGESFLHFSYDAPFTTALSSTNLPSTGGGSGVSIYGLNFGFRDSELDVKLGKDDQAIKYISSTAFSFVPPRGVGSRSIELRVHDGDRTPSYLHTIPQPLLYDAPVVTFVDPPNVPPHGGMVSASRTRTRMCTR